MKDITKQYDKSENDLKALQSVGQVGNLTFIFDTYAYDNSYKVLITLFGVVILYFYLQAIITSISRQFSYRLKGQTVFVHCTSSCTL